MLFSRRAMVSGALAAMAVAPGIAQASSPTIGAAAFDAFALLNPQPLAVRCSNLAGDRGPMLFRGWTSRLFGGMWQVAATHHFVPFTTIAKVALAQAASELSVKLNDADIRSMIDGYSALDLWPDALEVLGTLRRAKVPVRFLSNLPSTVLETNMQRHGLMELMGSPISTADEETYKPSPQAYALGHKAFGISERRTLFVASAGWDARGAALFGYPTTLVARTPSARDSIDVARYETLASLLGIEARFKLAANK